MKYGKWSDICVSIIPDREDLMECEQLQKTLSIRVAFLSEKRVGNVILGKKSELIMKSRNSEYFSLVLVFSRSKLKSPITNLSEFS